MCRVNCILFGAKNLRREEIQGKKVLEVGSRDVNGSLRPFIESRGPMMYVGIDIVAGPGVDVICDAENLLDKFELESFDLVISTEVLEHVRDWRKVISNIKKICRPGGGILITTVSIGFPFHEYPHDFWRYEPKDMENIFSDCEIETLERDSEKGVLIKVKKPPGFMENNLSGYKLYSPIFDKRVEEINRRALRSWHFKKLVVRRKIRNFIIEVGRKLLQRL